MQEKKVGLKISCLSCNFDEGLLMKCAGVFLVPVIHFFCFHGGSRIPGAHKQIWCPYLAKFFRASVSPQLHVSKVNQ